jgi:glycosyltransferase involved in cell wall biosynthesis
VVTAWQPGELTEETRNGVQIFRVGSRFVEYLRQYLAAGRSPAVKTADHAFIHGRYIDIAMRVLGTLNRSLWSRLWWPDSACVWFGPAVRKARKLLHSASADAVISVSPTFTAVLVGYRIAANTQRYGNWVIDLGDPFSFMKQAPPNNFRLYGALNRWFERRAFQKAAAISVTNQAARELYAQLYPESASKITVIPPLLTVHSPISKPESPVSPRRSAPLKLVFLGTLYGGIRRPDFLLQLFQKAAIPGAELHFFGDMHECRDSIAEFAALNKNIVAHGIVSRGDAMQAINDADILVNLGNDTAFQLPSKLVEYAATGKPILSISRAIADSSAHFLSTYPRAFCLSNISQIPTADQISRFTTFCADRSSRDLTPPELEKFLRDYRIDRVADQYEALLQA